MHILAAHLVYLMHMHHTLGTKWNDIASNTEYPSSDIQFRFLQEESAGFLSPCYHAVWALGKWKKDKALVERHPSGCWLDSFSHTVTDFLSLTTQNLKISSHKCARETYDATEKVRCVSNNLCTKVGLELTLMQTARNRQEKQREKSLSRNNNI